MEIVSNNPLVTVAVVTYNSGEFIVETLDSVKNQTYDNIELIVSDDCSTDDTVKKCEVWFSKNKDRFVRAELITVSKNTGVSGNSNRALSKATGEWYKVQDGDDMLLPDAIQNYIDFVTENPQVKLCVAPSIHFVEHFDPNNIPPVDRINPYFYRECMTAKRQLRIITKMFKGSGPTCFTTREAILSVGGFDERFPLLEDYPLLINLIAAGNKMYLMDKATEYKRVRVGSLQYQIENGAILTNGTIRSVVEYKYGYLTKYYPFHWRVLIKLSIWLETKIIRSGNTYSSRKCRIWNAIYKSIDPILWYRRIETRIEWIYAKIHYPNIQFTR